MKESFTKSFIREISKNKEDGKELWESYKAALTYAAAHVLETKKGERKKNWMILEILELMEERKLAKNIPAELGTERYKELKNKVQNECRKAKEKFLNEECREIERLQEINSAAYHKKKNQRTCITRREENFRMPQRRTEKKYMTMMKYYNVGRNIVRSCTVMNKDVL